MDKKHFFIVVKKLMTSFFLVRELRTMLGPAAFFFRAARAHQCSMVGVFKATMDRF